jgi:hypothetical protein
MRLTGRSTMEHANLTVVNAYIGLQKVKKEALNLVKMINLLKSAKTPMVVPFNFSFEGNPGK